MTDESDECSALEPACHRYRGDNLYDSTLFGYLIGLPLGIILTVTDKDGISPHSVIYRIIDVVTNIMRSIPFIILLMILIPFTRWLIGKSYGPTATIIPLVISAAPYISRMVESSLDEVDKGVVEAARSMGANNWTIIFRVLLPEAKTSLIVGATITLGTRRTRCRREDVRIPEREHGIPRVDNCHPCCAVPDLPDDWDEGGTEDGSP